MKSTSSRQVGNRGMGCPRGSLNRKTVELRAAVEEAQRRLLTVVPSGMELDAHSLLQTVYRDDSMPVFLRVEAAKSAVKFEKPALSSSQVDATVAIRLGIAAELVAANRRLASVVGANFAEIDPSGSVAGPRHRDADANPASLLAFATAVT